VIEPCILVQSGRDNAQHSSADCHPTPIIQMQNNDTRLDYLTTMTTPVDNHFVNTRMILAEMWRKKMDAMKDRERTRTMNGSTLSPGESSVYSLSIVFDEPPAPAARVELGFDTCEPVALRLT